MARITGESLEVVQVQVEVTIECNKCGKTITDTVSIVDTLIKVPPCEDCQRKEYQRGYGDGVDSMI